MIFNSNKIYAKVWNVKPFEKYLDLQVTTSEKDQEGNYINSSWFPRVIGHAFNSLKNVKANDRIVITKSKFTNERKKEEDGTYRSFFKFVIMEAEIDNGQQNATPAEPKKAPEPAKPAEKEEECPW